MELPRPPLFRRLRQEQWVAIDWAFTALLAVVYTLVIHDHPVWAGVVLVALAVLPCAARRRWPRAVLAITATSGAVAAALSFSPAPPVAVAFVMYLIPLRFPAREAVRLLIGTLLVTAAGFAVFGAVGPGTSGPGGIATAAGLLLEGGVLITAAWMIGYAVRQQRGYAAGLAEQARRRAHEQVAEARRTNAEQRLLIARELHDVVAHSMSVIAVQAGVANYVIGADAEIYAEEAARALTSIEQTSRSALQELRILLEVLRTDGQNEARGIPGDTLLPSPGVADLSGLVERAAEAGVRVDLDVRGDCLPLSAGLDLAAYRVVQEAVTNVIKHAVTGRCRVAVCYADDALTLEITNDGADGGEHEGSENGAAVTAGHGISGMRERVAIYGGRFQAGPQPEGGFLVRAEFPLATATA